MKQFFGFIPEKSIRRTGDRNTRPAIVDRPRFLLLLAVFYFSIPFVVYAEKIISGNTMVDGDGVVILQRLSYLGNSLREMDFPLWTPYMHGGKPHASGMLVSALYPINWLCSLLPGLLQIYGYIGIHYALGGTFLYLYLRKIDCLPAVSLAVSTIYLFTLHMGGFRKLQANLIATALWVPVILLFLELYLQRKKLQYLFLASAAMALQFLGGFLQYTVYIDILVFFYLLAGGIRRRFSAKRMFFHGAFWLFGYFGMALVGILPLAQLVLRLSASGGAEMSKEAFVGYSLHPIKLLMMIFPEIFGSNVWDALLYPQNWSSGFDIELLIGAPCVAFILGGISLFRQNYYARISTIGLGVTLVYACLGRSHFLTELFYHIPVLNMFRLPSRCLFLFTLCCLILIALGLDRLLRAKDFIRRIHCIHLAVAAGMLAVFGCYALWDKEWPGVERQSLKTVFLIPFLSFGIYLAFFYLLLYLQKAKFQQKSLSAAILPLILILVTVVQTFPYYVMAKTVHYEDVVTLQEDFPGRDPYGKYLYLYRGLGNMPFYMDAPPDLSINQSLSVKIMSLNGYENYNLPNLYKFLNKTLNVPMNSSGMYNAGAFSTDVIRNNSVVLSMFGTRYLITGLDAEESDLATVSSFETECVLLNENDLPVEQADGYQYSQIPVVLEPNSWYCAEWTMQAEGNKDRFYIDFNELTAPQIFSLGNKLQTFKTLLYSGNCAPQTSTFFRMIFLTQQDVSVQSLRLEKIIPNMEYSYRLITEGENYRIFENKDAKNLFYPSQRVVSISEEEKENLYLYPDDYDILNTSYVEGVSQDTDYSDAVVQISNIQLSNNRASAQILTDKDTFINMSQTFYPGWNAYLDGVKIPVYEVNGLIQGAFVPAGDHLLEFRFQPTIFYVGVLGTFITIGLCIWIVLRTKKEKKEDKSVAPMGPLRN